MIYYRDMLPTYETLLSLPDHLVGEVMYGEVYTYPRQEIEYARARWALGYLLGSPVDAGRDSPIGWRIFNEPELHLGDDIIVPDLAGWRRERLPKVPVSARFELVPDWVCEVTSPDTAVTDVTIKAPLYARKRVKHMWLVDIARRRLEHRTLQENGQWGPVVMVNQFDIVELPPFAALRFSLDNLLSSGPYAEIAPRTRIR